MRFVFFLLLLVPQILSAHPFFQELLRAACVQMLAAGMPRDEIAGRVLLWAVALDEPDVVAAVLPCGALRTIRDDQGNMPLLLAIKQRRSACLARLFDQCSAFATAEVAQPPDLTTPDAHGRTPLMVAAQANLPEVVRVLLSFGVQPNEPYDRLHMNALLYATVHADAPVIAELLAHRADQRVFDATGLTPLLHAFERGDTGVMQLLLGADSAPLERADICGYTPLMYAAERGDAAVVSRLLGRGVVSDTQEVLGKTALAITVAHNGEEVVQCLCAKGARSDIPDVHGSTALVDAIMLGKWHCLQHMLTRPLTRDEENFLRAFVQKLVLACRAGNASLEPAVKSPVLFIGLVAAIVWGKPGYVEELLKHQAPLQSGSLNPISALEIVNRRANIPQAHRGNMQAMRNILAAAAAATSRL